MMTARFSLDQLLRAHTKGAHLVAAYPNLVAYVFADDSTLAAMVVDMDDIRAALGVELQPRSPDYRGSATTELRRAVGSEVDKSNQIVLHAFVLSTHDDGSVDHVMFSAVSAGDQSLSAVAIRAMHAEIIAPSDRYVISREGAV